MSVNTQTSQATVQEIFKDVDLHEVIVQLLDEQRRLQAKVMVHEMLLMQTFLRFADATGKRTEFVELVMANIHADIKTTFANLPKDDVINRAMAGHMGEIIAELADRIGALAGTQATHLHGNGVRQ